MATPGYNTYVGMRYVPIFDGEWDRTKTYEPLTIVSYQGNSYTSRTFIPVGMDINNTDYWALTGNYNAQVEYYRQETARVAEEVETRIKTYANVEAMVSDTELSANTACRTSGYYTANDGGGAYYIVSSTSYGNAKSIELDNGLYANLITDGIITTAQLGYEADDTIDDVFSLNEPFALSYDHKIANDHNIDSVEFCGHTLSQDGTSASKSVEITKSKSNFKIKNLQVIVTGDDITVDNFEITKVDAVSGFLMRLKEASNVLVTNFTLKGIYEAGVVTNTDGIHFSHGAHDVIIANGFIESGDDAISLCADDAAIGVGGDIYNVTISNVITGDDTFAALRVLNQAHIVKNISIENCLLQGKNDGVIKLQKLSDTDNSVGEYTGETDNIRFVNCEIRNNNTLTSTIRQTTAIIDSVFKNVTMTDIKVRMYNGVNIPIRFEGQDNLKINNMTFSVQNRVALNTLDIIRINNVDNAVIDTIIIEPISDNQNITIVQQLGACDNLRLLNALFTNPYNYYLLELADCGKLIIGGVNATRNALYNASTAPDEFIDYDDVVKRYVGTLTYDGSKFPFDGSVTSNRQIVIAGRNGATGDLIHAWYDAGVSGFKVMDGTISSGQVISTAFVY